MKVFKQLRVVFLSLVMLFALAFGFACGDNGDKKPTGGYTVTFMVEGEQYGETQTVKSGRRITKPEDPTFTTEGYVFTGWFTEEDFAADSLWNFTTNVVRADTTLYAGYRVVSESVTDLKEAKEACTSKLVWTQLAVSDASAYEVKLTDKSGNVTTVEGTVAFDTTTFAVTFTPTVAVQGGKYTITVKDTTKTAEAAVLEDVVFGGDGSQNNPYAVGNALDFTMINQADVAEGVYFSLASSITIETSRVAQQSYTFNGTLLGNGRTITLENSNTAAIYKIGEKGYVYNVGVAGSVSTASFDSVGSIADFNAGKVEKINATVAVTSTSGTVGSNGLANALNAELADGEGKRGIAGGIVGTNLTGGVVYNCKITTDSSSTGTVKANVAGGTIVGLNYGKIELCVSNGCFGAWNSVESGKSLNKYSYAGGIAGINAGEITKCSTDGSGKLLAQRYTSASEGDAASGTNNANFGGIAGYNMENATITECYFAGIRVHADENVGGIVGLNAGAVSDCYAGGAFNTTTNILSYVGGRKNVGGIVGKLEATGTVANCFVTANVFAYTDGTAYSVAANATNSVYVSKNLNANSLAADAAGYATPVALTAPEGTGNVAVTIADDAAEATANYALAEEYLATVNGNNKFNFDGTTVVLNFQAEKPAEDTMEVVLYVDGEEKATETVAETASEIDGIAKRGYTFVGWAVEADGEVKFAKGVSISLYDLIDYVGADGKAALYAVYEVRVPNEGLIVAVWSRYVEAAQQTAIEEAYKAYMAQNNLTYSVEFRAYSESKIAEFGAAVNKDGDVDVAIGGGNTTNAANGFDYIARANMITEGLESRLAALMTDTERAVNFYAYITGTENADATVTFSVGGETTTSEINSIFSPTVTVPEVTVEEGYEFLGWATTENATEAEITAAKITYSTVKDLLTDGAVTLFPVIAKVESGDDTPVTTLNVSVWTKNGDWISDAELEAIKAGFETYLAGKCYTVADLTITYTKATATKVADLVAEIAGQGFDIVVGCGKSSGDLAYIEGGKKTMTFKSATDAEIDVTDRYAAQLTNNELAALLFEYLTAAQA